jgi:hypothetical protein
MVLKTYAELEQEKALKGKPSWVIVTFTFKEQKQFQTIETLPTGISYNPRLSERAWDEGAYWRGHFFSV